MSKTYNEGELKSVVIQHRDSGRIAVACYGKECDNFIVTIEEKTDTGKPEVQGLWGSPLNKK